MAEYYDGSCKLSKGEKMIRKILHLSFLTFFCALIYFSGRGMPLQDLLMKSFIVFISTVIVLIVVALFALKTVNKNETLMPTKPKK